MESRADIPPVLVTMFNRPDHATRVIAEIARVKPKRILLAISREPDGRPTLFFIFKILQVLAT